MSSIRTGYRDPTVQCPLTNVASSVLTVTAIKYELRINLKLCKVSLGQCYISLDQLFPTLNVVRKSQKPQNVFRFDRQHQ